MRKPLTGAEILAIAQEIIKSYPPLKPETTISERTSRAQGILRKWKAKCHEVNPNLVAGNPDPVARLFQFALHDRKNGIVYELKLNSTNPKAFLDKLIRKLVTYNTFHEASEDCRGLAKSITGKDYHKISEVHVFAPEIVINSYRETLISHYLGVIQKFFKVHIYFHPLE